MLGNRTIGDAPLGGFLNVFAFGRLALGGTAFLKYGSATGSLTLFGTANWDFRIFAATAEFVALDDSNPDGIRNYRGTLQKALSFERSILNGDGGIGAATVGFGEMEIINADGAYDYLIRQYAIDGRRIVVRVALDGLPADQFVTIYDGTATDWSVEEDVLRIDLRDRGYTLDVPAQPLTYGGTGGTDGTADLQGKRIPRALGVLLQIEPPLVVPNAKAFQVNSGPVKAISAVYSNGTPITPGPDYATLNALLAATIDPGSFATCLAAGWFRVNFVLEGQITADVMGDASGTGYVSTAAGIVRRIVTAAGLMVDPDGLYLPAFAAVETIQPAPLGVYLGPDDETTITDLVGRVMASVGGWAGFRRSGQYEVGIFTAPVGVPVERITRLDIATISREKLPDALSPPPYRCRIGYERLWSTLSVIAGAVADDRRAYLQQSVRLAEARSAQVLADHPLAKDPEPPESFFARQTDALVQ